MELTRFILIFVIYLFKSLNVLVFWYASFKYLFDLSATYAKNGDNPKFKKIRY